MKIQHDTFGEGRPEVHGRDVKSLIIKATEQKNFEEIDAFILKDPILMSCQDSKTPKRQNNFFVIF